MTKELKQQVKDEMAKNEKMSRELEQAERHIKELQEGHFTLKREKEEERARYVKELQEEVRRADALKGKHAALQTAYDGFLAKERAFSNTKREHHNLQTEHTNLQIDLANLKSYSDTLTNEVVELKRQVRVYCQRSDEDGAQIEKLKRERSLLRQMLYTGWENE